MTNTALANVHRAQNLDRLYRAAEAAYRAWLPGKSGNPYDLYQAYLDAKARYEDYRAMCTASPLDPLLPTAEEEEEP